MEKSKILLLFPDGVGIRNYLYSSVFNHLEEDLILFHNFDTETIKAIQQNTDIHEELTIPDYRESVKEKFLRELICLSRLHYNNSKVHNPTLLKNWNWNQKTFSKKIFYKTIEFLAPFFKHYKSILNLEKRYQKALRKNSFCKEIKDILKQVKPTVVFCSHQRALKAAPIFAAAKDLGIRTTTVIYSWDNLPKARMALKADNYLVWSDYMQQELNLYYPEIDSSQINVTGTPQFEFYEDSKKIINKEIFYQTYNLDPNKKIICYSGDDTKTSPDDPKYLRDIAEEIIKANLHDEYQILLRRCPIDFSGRFDEVVSQYKDLIKEAPPLWYFSKSKEWNSVYPTLDDVKLLVSTAFYSEIVINVGSTMAFDFAMFNKPCVFINYDQKQKTVNNWSVKTIYNYQHFKSMSDSNAVIWLNSKEEIVDKITSEKSCSAEMIKWKEVVLENYKNSSGKINNAIKINL
ncbi:hypothetical protein BD847_3852 [Flavobacterium cutihirudinis]|uniref:Monogalactosyldiacylglycerol (MGDG) synthase n=1 Tax=Flavobacterium cutihirudinis TaxID=1265740 RepID=A0A3D9FK53_9FLAO|nr:hypothetical protein [Flavobacterium cutihirudinis]RED19565.1 hypothetical protein BD847_3852 [Flavobacterium cutihirudinis]